MEHTAGKQKVTRFAVLPAVLSAVSYLFPYGFVVGSSNAATVAFQQFFNESHLIRYGTALNQSTVDTIWAVSAVALAIGGFCGSLLLRPLVGRFGIRATIVRTQALCCLAIIFMCISAPLRSYELLIIGRFIVGIFSGIGTGVAPMYISEISASHIRGVVGMCVAFAASFGGALGNLFGLQEVLGTPSTWPYLLAIAVVPSVACILYSPWMPESPKSLYLIYNDREGAEKTLRKLRGSDNVQDELRLLQQEKEARRAVKLLKFSEVFTARHIRWQTISAVVAASAFQLNGVVGIQFYLNRLLVSSGIEPRAVGYIAVGIACFQAVVTVIGGVLSDKFGRRRLLLVGNVIICVSLASYTFVVAFQSRATWLSYVSVGTVLAFFVGFCVGPSPVTATVIPELLDQSARPAVMTLSVSLIWVWLGVVYFITPLLFEHLKFAALLPFLAATTASLIYIYIVVPETKGKSVVAIQSIFAKRNKVAINGVVKSHDNVAYDQASDRDIGSAALD